MAIYLGDCDHDSNNDGLHYGRDIYLRCPIEVAELVVVTARVGRRNANANRLLSLGFDVRSLR